MENDRHLLSDIRLGLRHKRLRPVYAVDTVFRRVPSDAGLLTDIGLISGRDNLAQAIILRLLTPRGELAALGHPDYGSRLHELVGEQNTETTRNLARLFILESLRLESRIEEVIEVIVEPDQGSRDRINVLLRVKPIGVASLVTIGPFQLELEQ